MGKENPPCILMLGLVPETLRPTGCDPGPQHQRPNPGTDSAPWILYSPPQPPACCLGYLSGGIIPLSKFFIQNVIRPLLEWGRSLLVEKLPQAYPNGFWPQRSLFSSKPQVAHELISCSLAPCCAPLY